MLAGPAHHAAAELNAMIGREKVYKIAGDGLHHELIVLMIGDEQRHMMITKAFHHEMHSTVEYLI